MSTEFIVVRCSNLKCSRFSYCKAKQKTKLCPYCGRRIQLSKTKHYPAETTIIARKLVQEFNKRLGKMKEPKWYKPE